MMRFTTQPGSFPDVQQRGISKPLERFTNENIMRVLIHLSAAEPQKFAKKHRPS